VTISSTAYYTTRQDEYFALVESVASQSVALQCTCSAVPLRNASALPVAPEGTGPSCSRGHSWFSCNAARPSNERHTMTSLRPITAVKIAGTFTAALAASFISYGTALADDGNAGFSSGFGASADAPAPTPPPAPSAGASYDANTGVATPVGSFNDGMGFTDGFTITPPPPPPLPAPSAGASYDANMGIATPVGSFNDGMGFTDGFTIAPPPPPPLPPLPSASAGASQSTNLGFGF
jgi:hypothetical protein